MKKENPFKDLDIILIAKPDKDSTKMKIIMDISYDYRCQDPI